MELCQPDTTGMADVRAFSGFAPRFNEAARERPTCPAQNLDIAAMNVFCREGKSNVRHWIERHWLRAAVRVLRNWQGKRTGCEAKVEHQGATPCYPH